MSQTPITIINNSELNSCFYHLKNLPSTLELPTQFTYPFNYEPHPLCRLAVDELQKRLLTELAWINEFDTQANTAIPNVGKMFGILVVRTSNGEIGYLAAYSGNLAGKNNQKGFVPPFVDLSDETCFYRQGEVELNTINLKIKTLEDSSELTTLKSICLNDQHESAKELQAFRQAMKIAKQERDAIRHQAKQTLTDSEFEALQERLKNESLKWQYDYKQLAKQWSEKIAGNEGKLQLIVNQINTLKSERKEKSAAIQQQLFEQYQFLNAKGEWNNVITIFEQTDQKIPPAGAGECAAPKLLQYAYLHGMTPIAMAEFWWGPSPRSEIRKQGHFYPACRSKCEPILGFMLQGLEVEPNPVLHQISQTPQPEILFEDDSFIIVCKPAEYLSVPGKIEAESVYDFIRKKFPDATGPLIVHRLDMSTSGLMVVAKNIESYHDLQKQFMDRKVKKRYIAVLEGVVKEDEGIINLPLRVDLDNRPYQLVCYEYGKPAITKWKVIDRQANTTRVEMSPITGRSHQLRVHSAHQLGLNCPIVGDDLYGTRADRLHLHAEYLEFRHSMTSKKMRFTAPAPF